MRQMSAPNEITASMFSNNLKDPHPDKDLETMRIILFRLSDEEKRVA